MSTTDSYPTPTSKSQLETEKILLTYLPTSTSDHPTLQKKPHLEFLIRNLIQGLPSRYISQDASQPWLIYWSLQSFSILQVAIDPGNKQRAINTLLSFQNPTGGFGGGPRQISHLLPTYAAVCALAIVGRPGEGGGWDDIDRKKMYDFFMSLKQPDGSFTVSKDGEVDVRGIYCLIVVSTLLDILTDELVDGTLEFLVSCQTYEGGFSSTSFSFFSDSPRPPLGEAHGGYTFCATASYILLLPFIKRLPSSTQPRRINTHNLRRWLVHMQGLPSELGGFKGRTNKLVDGCYSWWVGGCFALVDALEGVERGHQHEHESEEVQEENEKEQDWIDEDPFDTWNATALQSYILNAAQHPAGGLRDKPPKSADSYHTLYCLSGLSAAQHHVAPDEVYKRALEGLWDDKSQGKGEDAKTGELKKEIYTSALAWNEVGKGKGGREILGGEGNRVNATHPLFNLTITHTEQIMAYFYGQEVVPPRG